MSAMGDGLNAGAATFTPGGDFNRLAEEMNDDSMLDEIEAELEGDNYGGGYNGSAYPDLPPHADEFWFPECRNCACCNGYKHGCQCCAKEGLRSCKCTGPGPAAVAPPPPPQGGWMPTAPGPGTGGYGGGPPPPPPPPPLPPAPPAHQGGGGGGGGRGGGHYGGGGRGGGGRGGGGGGRGSTLCRFFNSPGGCRFGDNCRFSHG